MEAGRVMFFVAMTVEIHTGSKMTREYELPKDEFPNVKTRYDEVYTRICQEEGLPPMSPAVVFFHDAAL